MAFLATEPLGFKNGNALNADVVKRLFHLVELEGLDNRFDLFHRLRFLLGFRLPNLAANR
jgi:hypothetical protein